MPLPAGSVTFDTSTYAVTKSGLAAAIYDQLLLMEMPVPLQVQGDGTMVPPADVVKKMGHAELANAVAAAISSSRSGVVPQAANLTLTDTTLVNTDLVLDLGVGTWRVLVAALFGCGVSTDGFKHAFAGENGLAASNIRRVATVFNVNNDTFIEAHSLTNLTTEIGTTGESLDVFLVVVDMGLEVTTAGKLRFKAAKNADAGADTTFQAGSSMVAI